MSVLNYLFIPELFLFRKTGLRLEKPGNHLAAVFIQNEIDNLSIIQYDMMNLGAGFPPL